MDIGKDSCKVNKMGGPRNKAGRLNKLDLASDSQSFFVEPDFIKDADCTKDTPVLYGIPDSPIYGSEKRIRPRIPGRTDTAHMQKIFLEELLPLEEYDTIIILLSGGKDSIACYYKMRELGVPKHKLQIWLHDIDGMHPFRHMDWRCTGNYIKAFAQAEQIPLRISWRRNGFFGELYRVGASEPIEWQEPDTGQIIQCPPSKKYRDCMRLKEQAAEDMEDQLKQLGYRMKFPAKSGDLSRRWCSAYLKIMVADTVIRNMDSLSELELVGGKRHKFPEKSSIYQGHWCNGSLKTAVQDSVAANLETTRKDAKILIVSGERRGESKCRSRYNEIELHRTNAPAKAHRIVHQWRPVIDYSERDVWEVLRRHRVRPHPCYACGWPRCSCAMCIFSTPRLFAGIREIYPEEFEQLRNDERILGFTLDNHCDLETYVGDAKSCVYHGDKEALHSLITGEFSPESIYVEGEWKFPAGAFHGAEGGPC